MTSITALLTGLTQAVAAVLAAIPAAAIIGAALILFIAWTVTRSR